MKREHATSVPDSYRPSLVKLTNDLAETQRQLMRGFESRADVLYWLQATCVRTLGTIPDSVIRRLARQFQPVKGEDTVLLAAFLQPQARERSLSEEKAQELRERFAATYLRPAHHYAFRHLRSDAGEYIDRAEGNEHDPAKQRYIAMRPALDELHQTQKNTLEGLLDGFSSQAELLDWAADVELATHGEIDETFARRAYMEKPTRKLLLRQSRNHERGRELFAAVHLLPAFNAGVRDLAGRAQEQPDADTEEQRPTTA